MSFAGVSRASPRTSLQGCLRAQNSVIIQQTRGVRKGPPKVEKDDKGQTRKRSKKDGPGVYSTPVRVDPSNFLQHATEFTPKALANNAVGTTTFFSFSENDPVRKFGLPKKLLLEYRVLSRPYTVIRDVTLDVVGKLNTARSRSSLQSRYVFTGRSGSGKSFLLLQAVEYCAQSDWVVIYIPRAVNLVNSTTGYSYDLKTQTFIQPQFAYQTLQRTLSVNNNILSSLSTTRKHFFEKREIPVGSSLTDLISLGLKDLPSAPAVLDALMAELGQQTKHPVLLAVDDFQALYCKTRYRDAFFASICSYHLSMPRLIMEYASGQRSFARGAVLGAITYSDPSYPLPLELRETLQMPYEHPQSPYDKRSKPLQEYTTGLSPIPVPEQLSLNEAASLFEVWKAEHVITPLAHDETFLSKYTESSGNPREFVRGLLSTLSV
ncbi:hypothetical protein AX14_005554 [Amanita brunnescens Koide BX004]|nr:hypothetical protein AX14_005554 [Amanita brunnescens Koide BX004]